MRFPFGRGGSLAALLALLLFPVAASAGLKYDLRLTGGGTTAYVTSTGTVVSIDLFAVVTGTASGPSDVEGFQNGFGAISSSTGGNITGNLSASLLAPFKASGSTAGVSQDFDADGDMDLGSKFNTYNTDFLFARAGSMMTSGTPVTNGVEFKLATISFAVTSITSQADFSPITISFRVPSFTQPLEIAALWTVDGVAQNSNGMGGGTAPTVGTSVTIAVPEPSSILLLSVAALAVIGPRRRRMMS